MRLLSVEMIEADFSIGARPGTGASFGFSSKPFGIPPSDDEQTQHRPVDLVRKSADCAARCVYAAKVDLPELCLRAIDAAQEAVALSGRIAGVVPMAGSGRAGAMILGLTDPGAFLTAAVTSDIESLAQGNTANVFLGPLWTTAPPKWIKNFWAALKRELRTLEDDWEVWIDWYEARINGQPANETLEVASMMVASEIWERGPTEVNAEIKRLIEVHSKDPGKPSAPINSVDQMGLEGWLRSQPIEFSTVLAARVALRFLPNFCNQDEGDLKDDTAVRQLLALFRTINIIWLAFRYPTQAARISALNAFISAYGSDTDRFSASHVVALAARTVVADNINSSVRAAFTAATIATRTASGNPHTAAFLGDIDALENGLGARELASQSLWSEALSKSDEPLWAKMKADLIARDEYWEVWTDWYEARLKGRPVFDALEVARTDVADDIWKQGPKVANAEIKRLMEEHSKPPRDISAPINFGRRGELETWLGRQPREVSVILAVRAALRLLPTFSRWSEESFKSQTEAEAVLLMFCAASTVWTGIRALTHTQHLVNVVGSGYNAAIMRVARTSEAASAVRAAVGAFVSYDSNAAVFAATVFSITSHFDSAREAIIADANAIESDLDAKALASRKLWLDGQPPSIVDQWLRMKEYLLGRGEDWEVWTDWYEAQLVGQPANEAIEIARVTAADQFWRQGPSVANAEVKKVIDKLSSLDLAIATEALQQRPSAFQFRVVEGKIDAAPEDAIAIDKDVAEDLYQEVKRKAQALKDRLVQIQADHHLRENLDRLLDRLGEDAKVLRPGLVLSSLRSLQSDLHAYDTEEGRKELFPDVLSKLVDLTETARDLAATFPKSREIEAEAVSLNLPMDRLEEIETHVVEMVDAVNCSDGATELAKTAIKETVAAISNSRSLADRAKQLSYSLLDLGNFTRAGLKYVKETGENIKPPIGRAAQQVGRELGGLGADSWRSFRRGFPRGIETGARTLGKAMVVGGATALMGTLAGPLAALGTLISSYIPLAKIANGLTDHTNDHSDADTSFEGEKSEEGPRPDAEVSPKSTPRKVRTRKSATKGSSKKR
jgi:hypothetical protein